MKTNTKNCIAESILVRQLSKKQSKKAKRASALQKLAVIAALLLGTGGYQGTIAPVWAEVQEIASGQTVQITGSTEGTVFDGFYGAGTLEIVSGKVVYTNDSKTWGSVSANNGTIVTMDANHPIYKWISTAKLNIDNGATLFLDKNSLGQSQDIAVNIASGGILEINTDVIGIHEMYEATVLSTAADGEMTLTGGGQLVISGSGRVCATRGSVSLKVAMDAGAEIRIEDTAVYGNGGYSSQNWTDNKADLYIASGASFDKWNGSANVVIGGLNGSGTILRNAGTWTVGAADRDGTFSGTFAATGQTMTKIGTGTQTFDCNVNFGATTITAGTLAVTAGHSFSASNLTLGAADGSLGSLALADGGTFQMTGTLTNYSAFSVSGLGNSFAGGINNYGTLILEELVYPNNVNSINNYADGTISIGDGGIVWGGSIYNSNNNTDNTKTATINVSGGGLSIQGTFNNQYAGAKAYITGNVYIKGNIYNQNYTSTVFQVDEGNLVTDGSLYNTGEFAVAGGNATVYGEIVNNVGGVFSVNGNLESLNSQLKNYGQATVTSNLTAYSHVYTYADSSLTVGNDLKASGEVQTFGGSTTNIGRDLTVLGSQLIVNVDNAAKATALSIGRNLAVNTNLNVKQLSELNVAGWTKIGTSINLEQPTAAATFGKSVTAGTSISNSGTLTVQSGDLTAGTSISNSGTLTVQSGDLTAGTSISNSGTLTVQSGDLTAGTSISLGTNSTTNIKAGSAYADTNFAIGTNSTVSVAGDLTTNTGNLSISSGSTVNIGGSVFTGGQLWIYESGETGSVVDIGGNLTITKEGYVYRGSNLTVRGDVTANALFAINQDSKAPTGSVEFQQSLAVGGNFTANGFLYINRNSQLTVGGDLLGTGTLNNAWNSLTEVAGSINLGAISNSSTNNRGGTIIAGAGLTTTSGAVSNNAGGTITVSNGNLTSGTSIYNGLNAILTVDGNMTAGASFENSGGIVVIDGSATGSTTFTLNSGGNTGAHTTINGDVQFGGAFTISWQSNPTTTASETAPGGLYVTGNLSGGSFTSSSNNVAAGYLGGYTSVGKSVSLDGVLNNYGGSTFLVGENLTTSQRTYNGPSSILNVRGNVQTGNEFENASTGVNASATQEWGADIAGSVTTGTSFKTGTSAKTHVGGNITTNSYLSLGADSQTSIDGDILTGTTLSAGNNSQTHVGGNITTGTNFGTLGNGSDFQLDGNLNVGSLFRLQNYSLISSVTYGQTKLTIAGDIKVQQNWLVNNDQQNNAATKTGTVVINVGGDVTIANEYMDNRMDTQLTVAGNVSIGSYLKNQFNNSVGPTMTVAENLTTGSFWEQFGGTATISGNATIGTYLNNSQNGTNGATTTIKKTLSTGAYVNNESSATLNVGEDLTSASETAIQTGSYLENKNQLNISKGAVKTGTYLKNSQTASVLSGSNASLEVGSSLENSGTITLNGDSALSTGTYLTNNGTISVSGTESGRDFTVNGTLTNNSGKSITYDNALGTFSTGSLINSGTISVTAQTLRLTGGIATNTGTLTGSIGALDVSGSVAFGDSMAVGLIFSGTTPVLYVGGNGSVGAASISGVSLSMTNGTIYLDVLDAQGQADYLSIASGATGISGSNVNVLFNTAADYNQGIGVIALLDAKNGSSFSYDSTTTPTGWSLTTRTEGSGSYLYAIRDGVEMDSLTIWSPGKSGAWNTASNWLNNTAPTADNPGYVLGGNNTMSNELTNATVYVQGGYNTVSAYYLTKDSGTFYLNGGTINKNDWIRISGTAGYTTSPEEYYVLTGENDKAGRLVVDGGTFDVKGFTLGSDTGNYGRLELKSGTVLAGSNGVFVGGGSGIGGELIISGGTFYSMGDVLVAKDGKQNSKLIVTGGTVALQASLISGGGANTMSQVDVSNASLTIGGALTFGNAANAQVNSTISHASLSVASAITFAQNGATFTGTISDSTINAGSTIFVGNTTNSQATLSIADSTINVLNASGSDSLNVGGKSSTGVLTMDNVAVNLSGRVSVGGYSGNGTITATNMPNASLAALYIGAGAADGGPTSHGNGTVSWQGGDLALSNVLYVGSWGGQGKFDFSGGLITTSELIVGHNRDAATPGDGPSVFTINKGSVQTGGSIQIGTNYGTGTLKFLDSEGVLTTADQFLIGNNGTGTLVFRGSAMSVGRELYAASSTGGTATIDYDGGALTVNGSLNVGTGTQATATATVKTAGESNIAGLFVGTGNASTATLTFTDSNITDNGGFAIGNSGGTGTLNLKNTVYRNKTGNEIQIGISGAVLNGTFNQSNGTMALDGSDFNYQADLFVGRNSGTGTLSMTNDSTATVGMTRIGYMNTVTYLGNAVSSGFLSMDDSTLNCTYLGIGHTNLSVGTATLTAGSVINNTGSLYVGYDKTTSAPTKAAGTLTMTDSLYYGTSATVGEGLNATGNWTATHSTIQLTSTLGIAWAGGTGEITLKDSQFAHILTGNSANTGVTSIGSAEVVSGVLYNGTGTLNIDNSNTFDGTTINFDARTADRYSIGRNSGVGAINVNKSYVAFSSLNLGQEGSSTTYSTYSNYSGGQGYMTITDGVLTSVSLALGSDYNNYGELTALRSDVAVSGSVSIGSGSTAVTLNPNFSDLKNSSASYGKFTISDGTFSAASLFVANGASSLGELNITGSPTAISGDIYVGRYYDSTKNQRGSGSMSVTNSNLSLATLYVGRFGGEGTLVINNGGTETLTTKGIYIGSSDNTDSVSKSGAKGTATIVGTQITNSGTLGIGNQYSSNGSLTIRGSSYTGGDDVFVGYNTINTDINTLNVVNSTFAHTGTFYVGRGELAVGSTLTGGYAVTKDSQARGAATFTDSTAQLPTVSLGYGGGQGALTINGASNVSTTGHLFVGSSNSQTTRCNQGILNVGGSSQLSIGNCLVAGYSTGLLYDGEDYLSIVNFADKSDTTIVSNMNLGRASKFQINQKDNATVTVQTTGNTGTWEAAGTDGSGSEYNLSGGVLNVLNTNSASWFYVGKASGASMSFNQSGGVANIARMNLDNTASVYNLSGGELNLTALTSKGTINVSGTGVLNMDSLTNDASASINVSGGLVNVRTLDVQAGTFTFTGGGLSITELYQASANGTFVQNGSGSVLYVGGKGQAGQLAIGSSTAGNSYALTNGTAEFDIVYDGASASFDYLKVYGGITLTADSTIRVNFTNTSTTPLAGDNFWVIAEGTSLTGAGLFKTELTDPNLTVTTMSASQGGILLVSYGTIDVNDMKIWVLDHTGNQSDENSWNANSSDATGYVIAGTNTIQDSVGTGNTLKVKGGTNTFSAALTDGALTISAGANAINEGVLGAAVTIEGGTTELKRTTSSHLGAVAGTTVELNGGSLLLTQNNAIGSNGKIVVNNGSLSRTTDNLNVNGNYAADADAGAILEINGGSVTTKSIALGYYQSGTGNLAVQKGSLYLNDGTVNLTGDLQIACSANCLGIAEMNGGTLKATGSLYVGYGQSSIGAYSQTDGTTTASNLFVAAGNTGTSGTFNLSGGSFKAGTVGIGTKSGATANVNLTGGTVWFTGVTTVGEKGAAEAKLRVAGAALEINNQLKGTGDVSVSNGGSIYFNFANAISAYGDFNSFEIEGMGGTWTDGASPTGALWFKNNTMIASNVTLTGDAGIRVDGDKATVTMSGSLDAGADNNKLVKLGSGTLAVTRLAGSSTPSIEVREGSVDLQISRADVLDATGGKILFSDPIEVNALVATGTSAMSFNVDDLSQTVWVTANESVSLADGAGLEIVFDDDKDFRSYANVTMNLVQASAEETEFLYNGEFLAIGQDLSMLLSPEMQERFSLTYAANPVSGFGSLSLMGKEIPEPTSICLLILGALGLAILRRRVRR